MQIIKKLKIKSLEHIIFWIILLFNGVLFSWTILNKDIIFNTDIASEFLVLHEISQKKIVLIGARASGIAGLFHGPLWFYLNYPAYWIGNGNPLVVGWYWIFLTACFLIICFT